MDITEAATSLHETLSKKTRIALTAVSIGNDKIYVYVTKKPPKSVVIPDNHEGFPVVLRIIGRHKALSSDGAPRGSEGDSKHKCPQ
jgi:hypothetical protein